MIFVVVYLPFESVDLIQISWDRKPAYVQSLSSGSSLLLLEPESSEESFDRLFVVLVSEFNAFLR